MHGEDALLFVGENGHSSNGLQLVSADVLVPTINARGRELALVVLSGCKTSAIARRLLAGCPRLKYCVCWSTLVHSEAAAIFGAAFAEMLEALGFFRGHEDAAVVEQAFYEAQAAVMRRFQTGWLQHVGPVRTPLCKFVGPEDEHATYQACPCGSQCDHCPYVLSHLQSPVHHVCANQTCTMVLNACRLIGRARVPHASLRLSPPLAVGRPLLFIK